MKTNDMYAELFAGLYQDIIFEKADIGGKSYMIYGDLLLETIKILDEQYNTIFFERIIFPKKMDKEKLVGFAKFFILRQQ